MTEDLLDRWLEATSLDPDRLTARRPDRMSRPEPHKSYPGRERVSLPRPPELRPPPADLWQVLARRRSRREFSGGPVALEDLAALLWACQGVTARHGPYLLRTAPSAGALYPFETYVSVQSVAGIEPCLAHLHVPDFALEVLAPGHHGRRIALAALAQGFLQRASVVVLWTAVYPRAAWKYGHRAMRYIGMDLGHVCQNLALAAEALGLGCCPVAAFFDREMDEVLGVDGRDEFAYYLAAVGPLHKG